MVCTEHLRCPMPNVTLTHWASYHKNIHYVFSRLLRNQVAYIKKRIKHFAFKSTLHSLISTIVKALIYHLLQDYCHVLLNLKT